MSATAPMVVADLPIPPGFAIEVDDLKTLIKHGAIARSVVIYLRGIDAGESLTLQFG